MLRKISASLFSGGRTKYRTWLLFALFAIGLNLNQIFEWCFQSQLDFRKIETEKTISYRSTSSLKNGDYYVSAGRAQGSCTLRAGGNELANNRGVLGVSERTGLYIGSRVIVDLSPVELELDCEKLAGSPVRLIHSIYVNKYRTGMFVHLLRQTTDIALPIIFVVFFLCFILTTNRAHNRPIFNQGALICSLTLLYLISLANFPRLFIENEKALFIHSNLKFIFTFSTIGWTLSGSSRHRIFLTTILIGFLAILAATYGFHPEKLFLTYFFLCHFIPVVIFGLYIFSRFERENSASLTLVPFIIVSVLDLFFLYADAGKFLAPAVALTIFSVAVEKYINGERASYMARKLIANLSVLLLDKKAAVVKLTELSKHFSDCSSLSRWSIYVDSYFLGKTSRPNQELHRIASSNDHRHPEDPRITLDVGTAFGEKMRQAYRSGDLVLDWSDGDKCIYLVQPIPGIGCLNFSATARYATDLDFVQTIVAESRLEIATAVTNIVKSDLASNLSVSAIREALGPGVHEVHYGAIFADAIGYTQNVERSDKFVDFFQFEYIPALLRYLGKNATLKDLFGDELFLIVHDFDSKSNGGVYRETANIVGSFQKFVETLGAQICSSAGFSPIEFKIGANAGLGQITVTGSDLSISGPVIEAKRHQGRARAGEPFVSGDVYLNGIEVIDRVGVLETYAAKKEILRGYRISKGRVEAA